MYSMKKMPIYNNAIIQTFGILTFSNKLLHELWPRHSDEGTVCMVGYSSSQQGLSRSRRSIQQHTLQTNHQYMYIKVTEHKQMTDESKRFHAKFKNSFTNNTVLSLTFGCAIPRASNSSGCLTGSSITSLISLICLSSPPIISYVESGTFSTIISETSGSTLFGRILWSV